MKPLTTLFFGMALGSFLTVAIQDTQKRADAAPQKPPKLELPKEVVPDLAGVCQYGTITQTGRALEIKGPRWTAIGDVRPGNKIFLLWEEVDTGRIAPSLYKMKDGSPDGLWGWGNEVYIEGGELVGQTIHDRLSIRIKE